MPRHRQPPTGGSPGRRKRSPPLASLFQPLTSPKKSSSRKPLAEQAGGDEKEACLAIFDEAPPEMPIALEDMLEQVEPAKMSQQQQQMWAKLMALAFVRRKKKKSTKSRRSRKKKKSQRRLLEQQQQSTPVLEEEVAPNVPPLIKVDNKEAHRQHAISDSTLSTAAMTDTTEEEEGNASSIESTSLPAIPSSIVELKREPAQEEEVDALSFWDEDEEFQDSLEEEEVEYSRDDEDDNEEEDEEEPIDKSDMASMQAIALSLLVVLFLIAASGKASTKASKTPTKTQKKKKQPEQQEPDLSSTCASSSASSTDEETPTRLPSGLSKSLSIPSSPPQIVRRTVAAPSSRSFYSALAPPAPTQQRSTSFADLLPSLPW